MNIKDICYFDEKKSVFEKTTGYLMFFLGLILTLLIHPAFLIAVGFGVKALIYQGTALDLYAKAYKHYYRLFGVTSGRWKQLPKPEHLSILTATESQRVWVGSASTKVNDHFFKINLFHDGNEHIEIFRCGDEKEVYEMANKLGKLLETDVYDSIEEKWL